MEYKTIIDDNEDIIDLCIMFINGKPQDFEMKENYKAVELYKDNYVKPKYNKNKWIESATEEEIKVWQEENKIENEEPTENDILIANLIKANAEQQNINIELMKQIAELKGDN